MMYARSGRLWGLFRNITGIRVKVEISISSVAGAGIGGKIFFEFAFHALEILGVGRRFLLLGDVRPALGIFGIDLEPFFQARLGVRLDGVGGAFPLAHAPTQAFLADELSHVLNPAQ